MADDPPLSDEAVYAILHEARLSFSNRTVATTLGRDVLGKALRDIDFLQIAMTDVMDQKATETPDKT